MTLYMWYVCVHQQSPLLDWLVSPRRSAALSANQAARVCVYEMHSLITGDLDGGRLGPASEQPPSPTVILFRDHTPSRASQQHQNRVYIQRRGWGALNRRWWWRNGPGHLWCRSQGPVLTGSCITSAQGSTPSTLTQEMSDDRIKIWTRRWEISAIKSLT